MWISFVSSQPNAYPNMWIEKEYYYDSSKTNRQKTDTEYAEDLKKFIDGIPVRAIYIDPSAASFKLECQRNGIRNILDAENEVLDGIRFVATLLNNGTLKITRCCKTLIQEMSSYVWDSKAKNLGEDKPLKKNDHLQDALRYLCYTAFGKTFGSQDRMKPEDIKNLRRKAGVL